MKKTLIYNLVFLIAGFTLGFASGSFAGTLSGTSFEDSNANGVRDLSELPLDDWSIELTGDALYLIQNTDIDGNYSFLGLPDGEYTVSEICDPGWSQSLPSTTNGCGSGVYTVTLLSGDTVTGLDFGNRFPNYPPTANPDDYITTRNTPLVVNPLNGVLANDFDIDGDPVSVDLSSSHTDTMSTYGGTVAMSTDGSFTYTPPLDFTGIDDFEYDACDDSGACMYTTVYISVETFADVVGDPSVIPDSSFSDMGIGHRTAMLAILAAAERDQAAGRIDVAIRMLENLLEHVNGCDGSSTESPDGDDWITNCDDQRLIRGLIEGRLAHLRT